MRNKEKELLFRGILIIIFFFLGVMLSNFLNKV